MPLMAPQRYAADLKCDDLLGWIIKIKVLFKITRHVMRYAGGVRLYEDRIAESRDELKHMCRSQLT